MAMRAEAAAAAELWDEIVALADGLGPDEWAQPSPCAGWSVKDVFAHMSGLQTQFDGSAPQPSPPDGWTAPEGLGPLDVWTETGVAARRAWTPEQVRKELALAREGHVRTLESTEPDAPATGPRGPTTARGLYEVRMFDLWAHVQDVHLAVGRPVDTAAATTAARDACSYLLPSVPVLAAKRAGLGEGQRLRVTIEKNLPSERTVVVNGGRAAWVDDDDAAEPEGTVQAAPGALTLLLAGRRSADEWRTDRVLDWSGSAGEAFVTRARVFG